MFAQASAQLARLVPFDGCAWLAADPGTGLPTAPTLIQNFADPNPGQCMGLWRREFLVKDVNLYRDIARAAMPAAALRSAAVDPRRSTRYRTFIRPCGFEDELRAVLRVGETTWGLLALMRRAGSPPFGEPETRLVASLSAPLGEALRHRARPLHSWSAGRRQPGPGVLMFDRRVNLVAASEAARAWLDELPHDDRLPSDLGIGMPMWVAAAASRAASVDHKEGDGTARVRVRTRRGTWLICHATRLTGAAEGVAVVLEPAQAAEIAPIIVEAYGLTAREREVTRLIARGLGTAQIAREMFLSTHTVRDYVKAVLQKVEVSTRGELMAKLYAEHYEPLHLAGAVVSRTT